jgi:hypothetical protein
MTTVIDTPAVQTVETDAPATPAVIEIEAPATKKTVPLRTAVTIAASTAAAVIVGLIITAASISTGGTHVPVRTILDVTPSTGTTFGTDLAQGTAEQQVQVNGQYLHFNLDTLQVQESGWKITKEPIDPKSPIQAYNLAPVK